MKKYRHLGVYGTIIENDKILLIRKSRGAYTGKLDLPGGGIEHGETPEECLKREIEEETGLIVNSFQLEDVLSINFDWQDTDDIENLHHLGIIYNVRCEDGVNKTDADGLDSLGSNWYNISGLNKKELSPFANIMLEKLELKR